jgi:hypothetical protein
MDLGGRLATPEQLARHNIDRMLELAGWSVQDAKDVDFTASRGVALREFPLKAGFADYMLFVDRQAVGIVEAKKEGTTLSGVDTQSSKYLDGLPAHVQRVGKPLPFAYESTGVETVFRDVRDPDYRSRRVFSFHQPETLLGWARELDTLRVRLKEIPPLVTAGLRECQVEAIEGLEHSLSENRPRSLIQMATGSGKTFTAVSFSYRLIKHAGARRVLFLVDRANLGRQTLKEFQQYATPDDGRKFTELYNVQHLEGGGIDPVSKVCISTIQRLYSMLRVEELDESLDEASLNEITSIGERPKELAYNPQIPIETFDLVVVDECHRSIYNVWRQVLEYFDAFLIGLTATPCEGLRVASILEGGRCSRTARSHGPRAHLRLWLQREHVGVRESSRGGQDVSADIRSPEKRRRSRSGKAVFRSRTAAGGCDEAMGARAGPRARMAFRCAWQDDPDAPARAPLPTIQHLYQGRISNGQVRIVVGFSQPTRRGLDTDGVATGKREQREVL